MNENLKKAVEQLILQGYVLLRVDLDGKSNWYIIYKWNPAYFNTAESVEYHSLDGVEITEFLEKNSQLYHNYEEFISHFNNYIDEHVIMHCEFSKQAVWYKYQVTLKQK